MLQAYFDGSTESGIALIVAGYMATVNSWLKFSDDWAEFLTISPRMTVFKMSAIGQFQMERAMFHYRAIERATLIGIGCAISIESLANVVRNLNLDPINKNPYYLAWRAVVTLSLEAARLLRLEDQIEFVFDEQSDKVPIIKSWDYYYSGALGTPSTPPYCSRHPNPAGGDEGSQARGGDVCSRYG